MRIYPTHTHVIVALCLPDMFLLEINVMLKYVCILNILQSFSKKKKDSIFLESDDPRIKFLFDEEHRKREELLELHLDMPGLFRELVVAIYPIF